jgi:hypothetical protein
MYLVLARLRDNISPRISVEEFLLDGPYLEVHSLNRLMALHLGLKRADHTSRDPIGEV